MSSPLIHSRAKRSWAEILGPYVAVVAVLVAVGFAFHFGAKSYYQGQRAISRTRLVNEGQQIAEALTQAHSDGLMPGQGSLELLQKDGHLERIPPGWVEGEKFEYVEHPGLTPELCAMVNKESGLTGTKKVVRLVKDDRYEQTAKFGCNPLTKALFYKF